MALIVSAVGVACEQPGPTPSAPTTPTQAISLQGTEDMAGAAMAFLATLDNAQRDRTRFAFDDEERFNWHYVPRRRQGLSLDAMTEAQRQAAFALLQAALSTAGYEKTTGIIALEGILGQAEGNPAFRDAERYYMTIFGSPSHDSPWGWRFEGHHLSLNFSSITDSLTIATPAFLGANPAEVQTGPRAGWRVLAEEEDRALALLHLLTDEQRARALIADRPPRDILTGADRRVRLAGGEGIPASILTGEQQTALLHLIDVYLGNMKPEIAERQRVQLREASLDRLYFAWAGGTERGDRQYYRIHGPTLLIEYDNTQNNANHIHTVWRDPTNDFGEDALRRHYEMHEH